MPDPFLLLTPFLVLAVLALVRFIGCQAVFGLDEVRDPPDPPGAPQDLMVQYGDETVILSWTAVQDATSYQVKFSDTPGGPYAAASGPTSPTALELLAYGVTRYYVVHALIGETEGNASNEVPATGARALIALVQPFGTPQTFFNGWLGMRIAVGPDPIKVVALGRVKHFLSPPDPPVLMAQLHDVKIMLPGATAADPAVDVPDALVSVDPGKSIEAGDFLYVNLPAAVVLDADTSYYVVSHETAQMTDPNADGWHDFDTTAFLNAEATLTEGVYRDDATTTETYTVSGGGAGHTYVPVNVLYQPGT